MNQVVVKVEVFDNDTTPASRNTQLCVAEGNGPVNALANARTRHMSLGTTPDSAKTVALRLRCMHAAP